MCERVSSTAVLDGVTCRRTYWNYSFKQFNLEYQDQGLRSILSTVYSLSLLRLILRNLNWFSNMGSLRFDKDAT